MKSLVVVFFVLTLLLCNSDTSRSLKLPYFTLKMSDFNPKETIGHLLKELVPAHDVPHAKVSVVGVGQVGMACAFSVLVQV